jgi:enterochelin esterase-like enzyme
MLPRRLVHTVGILLVALVLGSGRPALAQMAPRQPTPNDTLVSPEVLPDRRVTLRIYAPKATTVTVVGDWMEAPAPLAFAKDDVGVWSATVGPLVPDFYTYTLMVDGVRTLDPKNALIKQGINNVDNMFFVPGPEAAFQDLKPVPHGEIRKSWYKSSTLGTERRLHIYTPPGYDDGTTRYPVLYLLHGGGDEDSGWSTIGRAGFILDNLIADGKAVPMLVVMPNGSLPRPANLPAPTPGAPPDPAVRQAMQERFTTELMKDVIPFVEKRYRVRTGADTRALAGLSMGGAQTLSVITKHPDAFRYAAIWSAGLFAQTPAEFEAANATFLSRADRLNKHFGLLSITVGDKDFALPGSKNLAGVLKKHGIEHEFSLTGGGHTWLNWRRYLNDLAPRLFRPSNGTE